MVYQARVTREGEHWLAEFPDCPGCQTFADSEAALGAEAQEALEGWLEAELAAGRVPPAPRPRRATAGGALLEVFVAPALAARVQLRQAREAAGLSQGELAKRVGVTRQAISQLESPDANLRLSTLERVAGVLGFVIDLTLRPALTRAAAG